MKLIFPNILIWSRAQTFSFLFFFSTSISLLGIPRAKFYESSVITRSHLSSKTFTASLNSTSGGNAPVDSMVTTGKKEKCKLERILSKSFHEEITLNLKTYKHWNNYLCKTETKVWGQSYCINIWTPTVNHLGSATVPCILVVLW